MSSVIIMVVVSIIVIIMLRRADRQSDTGIEVLPANHQIVEVEIIDEMTKEKVRNLYEEQDVCNARISFLMKQNKQYEYEISQIDEKIQRNLDEMRMQLTIQPNMNVQLLKAGFEQSNQNLNKHRLKIEGMMITNAEKIISCKKKSNAISEQITKIGKEVYSRRMM